MATYDGYLQLIIGGRAGGQNVNNILYYGDDAGDPFTFNDAQMASFLADWEAQFASAWVGAMADTYTLATLTAYAIDVHGGVISDNPAQSAPALAGTDAGDCSSPAVAAVLSFQTSSIASIPSRSLRRSYLAIGPVPEVHVNTNGSLTATALTEYGALAALVASSLDIGFFEYQPVRLARTEPLATPAVGTIVSAVVQPYVTFRKSRKFRPDGT